jgi:hypothetical protein
LQRSRFAASPFGAFGTAEPGWFQLATPASSQDPALAPGFVAALASDAARKADATIETERAFCDAFIAPHFTAGDCGRRAFGIQGAAENIQ